MIPIGDTHGNFEHVRYEFSKRKNVNYVHVGDVGMLFNLEGKAFLERRKEETARVILDRWNNTLIQQESFLYLNRGNHDNPRFWKEAEKWNLSNIRFMPDYSIAVIEDQVVLFVGGAITFNRTDYYAEGTLWWKDEGVIFDEAQIERILKENDRIDIVVTHTAPNFCYPLHFDERVTAYFPIDPELKDDLLNERLKLTYLYQFLTTKFDIKHWLYGHFHFGMEFQYNKTKFRLIKVNEFEKPI